MEKDIAIFKDLCGKTIQTAILIDDDKLELVTTDNKKFTILIGGGGFDVETNPFLYLEEG